MKLIRIVIGLLVILGVSLGIFAWLRSHHTDTAPDEAEAPPTVVSVQTGTLKRMTLHHYVTGYGTVAPMPATATESAADAPLSAPVAGVVIRVNVVEGQHVEKGDVLVDLNSSGATLDNSQQEVARQKQLYAEHNTSLRNLQNAEAQLAMLRVIAPLSGTVVRVNARVGAAADLTTILAEVIDLNRLAVNAEIPAAEASALKPGDPVEILSEPPVKTELLFVSPDVDKNNGTILVRAALPAGGSLRPGEFVPLRILTAVHPQVLAAPNESVVTDESGKSVIALVQQDEATQIPVRTGLRENGSVEIVAPDLKEGDIIVTIGAYGLPKKTKIHIQNTAGAETSTNSSGAK
jgi:membrane fusion protein (multidrug efflux system)